MKFRREPEPGRIEKVKQSVRCHAADAGHRVQAGFADAAPKVRNTASNVSSNVVETAQVMAHNASNAATSAAHTTADAASAAAHTAADRARPIRDETVARSAAAWSVLRNGVPAKRSMLAGLASVPVAAAGKASSAAKSRGGSALVLATASGVATMGVLWWRRSRANAAGDWITDPVGADDEPRAGWHESGAVGAVGTVSAAGATAEDGEAAAAASAKPADCADPETCRDPAHTWP